jgi:hypothetical protein
LVGGAVGDVPIGPTGSGHAPGPIVPPVPSAGSSAFSSPLSSAIAPSNSDTVSPKAVAVVGRGGAAFVIGEKASAVFKAFTCASLSASVFCKRPGSARSACITPASRTAARISCTTFSIGIFAPLRRTGGAEGSLIY